MALSSGPKKDYPVTIGGKKYLLRYNYDALTFVEDQTGKSFFDVLNTMTKSMRTLGLVLYAGLRKNHPDLQISDVGDLMDDAENLTSLIVSVTQAVNNYFVRGKKAEPADTKKNVAPSTTEMAESIGLG